MLSMNNLGSNGRLGNQMFQYASLKGIARRHDYDFCIPPSLELNPYLDHMLLKIFKMKNVNVGYGNGSLYSENGFRFNEDLFNSCPDNLDLAGYFQSPKYFNHIREELIEDFSFKDNYDIDMEYDVAIHVRRGDYVEKTQYHGLCSEQYYYYAMSFFPQNTKFLVVSDDIEWCMQQEIFKDCKFSVSNNSYEDLYLMTKAKCGNIIANSSFSWWGAWLNTNKDIKVVAPSLWFNPSYMSIEETQDLFPNEWIKI